jgi:hypothetical protein
MNVRDKAFVTSAILEMLNQNVKISFIPKTFNTEGSFLYGKSRGPLLEIKNHARDDSDESNWYELFLHEYCHFQQYYENKYIDAEDLSAENALQEWLEGDKSLSDKQIRSYVRRILASELDCERRVIRLVKKNRLSVDTKEYIRSANACLLSYLFLNNKEKDIYKYHLWDVDEIINLLPTKFLKSYNKIPPAFKKACLAVLKEHRD